MAKKEKYRLEPLVKIRERAKREAEMALARSIKALDDEKKKLLKLEDLKQGIVEKRIKARDDLRKKIETNKARVRETQFHLGYMEKMKEDEEKVEAEIKEQKEAIVYAEEKVKKARRDYIDAANGLRMMEKHKELWVKKQLGKLNALENKMLNEIGNVVFQINRMK